jgi:hypothetical protein
MGDVLSYRGSANALAGLRRGMLETARLLSSIPFLPMRCTERWRALRQKRFDKGTILVYNVAHW